MPMREGFIIVVSALTLTALARGGQEPQPPTSDEQRETQTPYVFESFVDMVSVPVAVVDDDDNFVTGLTVDKFTVYEDGVAQEIQLFAAGLEESWVGLDPEAKDELSGRQVVGLVLDASGSMEDDMRLVREAVIKFLTNLPKTENLFIIDFDESIRLSRYSTDDQRVIADRIYDVEAEGWTSLYDAVGTFLERVYGLDGRKTLIVFSDGVDSRSTLGVGDVLDMVKLSEVTIHTIQFTGDRTNTNRTFSEGRFLRELSSQTGGSYALGRSLESLDELYDRILEELFSQYTIGYVSSNTSQDGKYRKIKVEVDVEGVDLRYRKGYYGPVEPQ